MAEVLVLSAIVAAVALAARAAADAQRRAIAAMPGEVEDALDEPAGGAGPDDSPR
jgi:hypothetical protein